MSTVSLTQNNVTINTQKWTGNAVNCVTHLSKAEAPNFLEIVKQMLKLKQNYQILKCNTRSVTSNKKFPQNLIFGELLMKA